ncbi:MAG: glycosyltransferase family 39 protein [Thermoflexus sp.]|nr:glycosyltransferase family 39 protein [Thermoflexus sp.]
MNSLLVLSTAFLLYLNSISLPSVWFDEGWSWHLAQMPILEMLQATAADRSPFLYYLFLHFWIRIAGESEWALRWPSAAFGLLATALAGRIAARGWGRPAGIFTMGLMGFSPFWLYYIQEARMYTMLAAGTLAALWSLEAAIRRPTGRRFFAWTLSAAGTALTHYFGLFPVAIMAIVLGVWSAQRPEMRRRWVWSMLGLAALVGPWMVFARGRFVSPEEFLRPPMTAAGMLSALAHGFWPGEWTWILAVLLASAALFQRDASVRRWALLTLGTLVLVMAVILGIFPRFALFHPRYVIFLWAFWVIGIGGGATRLGEILAERLWRARRSGWIGALFLFPLLAVLIRPWWAWLHDPHRGRDPYREAVAHVAQQVRLGEAALALRANWAVLYYWERIKVPAPLLLGPASPVWEEQQVLQWLEEARRRAGPAEGPWRLWLFSWQQEVVDPLGLFDGLLLENGFEVGGRPFGGLWVAYYETWPPFHRRVLVPLRADFEGKIELRGVHLRAPRWPGDLLGVTVAWARVGPVPRPPRMFIHVLNPAGRLVAQRDGPLPNDLIPISTWPLDRAFPVFARVVLPPDLHGRHTIRVGLYDPESGARWRVQGARGEGDGMIVGEVEIP